jgi:hypothetical protein
MDRVAQAIAASKAETKRLKQVRAALTALQSASGNGGNSTTTASHSSRTISASARKKIAQAQKAVGRNGGRHNGKRLLSGVQVLNGDGVFGPISQVESRSSVGQT